jgi:hypothetical protein
MLVAISLGVLVGLVSLVAVAVLLLAAAEAVVRLVRRVEFEEPEVVTTGRVQLIHSTDAERPIAA